MYINALSKLKGFMDTTKILSVLLPCWFVEIAFVCKLVCVCLCVRVCVCMHACVHACMHVCMCVSSRP